MNDITSICKKYNLYLIEDCAQAHFSEWQDQKVGTFGDVGTFSFFPGKNLGAYGDAGGIITNNDELALKMRMYANHGALKKHRHEIEGINSRLDGIQAAILSVKLPYIHEWNTKRLLNGLFYNDQFKDVKGITTPFIHTDIKHVFHLYVVRVENRSIIQAGLKELGVVSGIHYPTPLPFLKAFEYLNYKPEDFPVAYDYMDKILSLPMYPELTHNDISAMVKAIDSMIN